MGFPVSHSWSPAIFSHLARTLDYPLDYRRIEVPSENLDESVRLLRRLQLFQGWNVTLPYKEKFLGLADELSAEAKAIGAVNLVKVTQEGRLWGYNTDVLGVQKTFEEQKAKITGNTAVIFGAGGAALSVGYALGTLEASEVWMVNRTLAKAQSQIRRLKRIFPGTGFRAVQVLPEAVGASAKLMVNATPLGMTGFPKKSLLPRVVASDVLVFDLVYHPAITPLLRASQKRGLASVGGLDMLLWQALASWEIWVGRIPHIQRVKKELKQQIVTLRESGV